MRIHKTLLALLVSATPAFGSSGVDQLRFLEVSGAAQGISLESLAISDANALTLGPGGSVARLGAVSRGLQFGIEKSGVVPNVVGTRSITATSDYFIVGGEAGGLAVGRISQSGIDWQKASAGTSNSMNRVAILGGNLVATTGGRKTFYGSASNLNSMAVSDLQGGSFLESYVNVVGFTDGKGAIVGNGGVIRYSSNGGASFVNARPFGSSAVAVTDAAKLGERLYATASDGSVLSSDIPADLSKSPAGWNWQSVNVSGARALRGIALYGDQLVVVGDGGAAYYLKGTNWTALENLPASAKSADLIAVKTATRGEFNGAALIASKSTIYLGTPVPKPAVLSLARLETCSSNDIPAAKTFLATPVADPLDKFVQVDWFLDGNRSLTNSPALALFEHRTGSFKYQAVARDYRSGVESAPVEVTHQVFQNPAAPVAVQSLYEQCASEPTLTLAVAAVEGVHFEWYDSTGVLLTEGVSTNTLTYTPPVKKSGTYFVEAVATHDASECRSVTRTQIQHFVYTNPEAPVAVLPEVEACASEPTAVLAVKPGAAGIVFRWYASVDAPTNVFEGLQFVAPTTTNAVYFVQAVDTNHVTACTSARIPVKLTVHANPAPPVAVQPRVEQCAGDEPLALAVKDVAGLRFEWFTAATGGEKVWDGASFVPTNRVSATYYVESVDTNHITSCRSVTRTPVELKVNPLPDAPVLVNTKLSFAACEDLPTLAVQAQDGLKYAWYASATGSDAVSTNATFTPTAKETQTYYVEATRESTGCRSTRTAVTLTIRPAIQLTSKDVIVPYGDTNTSVVLKVGMTPDFKDYHTSTWSGKGDGAFTATNAFSTTYVPGTNDLAGGIVNVSLEVVDSGVRCSAQTAEFRIIYAKAAPDLEVAVDKTGTVTITWPPAPGYKLVSSESAFLTEPVDVAGGEVGKVIVPAESVAGSRFYRLVPQ